MQGGPHYPPAHCKIDVPVDMRPVQGMQAWRLAAEHRLALLVHWDTSLVLTGAVGSSQPTSLDALVLTPILLVCAMQCLSAIL